MSKLKVGRHSAVFKVGMHCNFLNYLDLYFIKSDKFTVFPFCHCWTKAVSAVLSVYKEQHKSFNLYKTHHLVRPPPPF